MIIIKNPSRIRIETSFRGRPIVIKAKGSLALEEDEEGKAKSEYLLQTWQFLQDKTPKGIHPIGEVKKARGVRIR